MGKEKITKTNKVQLVNQVDIRIKIVFLEKLCTLPLLHLLAPYIGCGSTELWPATLLDVPSLATEVHSCLY